MNSRAGQANEAGSVHRRGVAVYLAAHGLASLPVAAADPGSHNPIPVALQFETAHATDDLLCTLSDHTRLFISAKRTCGKDVHLLDTIRQWGQQVEDLLPGDRLVLATAEPKGIVRDLGRALQRRRRARETVFSAPEQTALSALEPLLPAGRRERIMDAAVVLTVKADAPGENQHDIAVGLIEGTVVPAGSGRTALSHLAALMHNHAGTAYSGDLQSWVHHLHSCGVTVYADPDGPAGAQVRAQDAAIGAYRDWLAAEDGRVDLTMLADHLRPLVIQDLAERLRVTNPDEPEAPTNLTLLWAARQRPRLLINGLPGAGKSAAMTQLAARWATNPLAPLPVLVRLRELLPACTQPGDVTLDRLCELAAARAPHDQRSVLTQGMRRRVEESQAVLLLDGLDECLDHRGTIAEGLDAVLRQIPAETGVVLTTRPVGTPAAARLDLEESFLSTPVALDQTLTRVLEHIAEERIAEAERRDWVISRSRRVRDVIKTHRDIGAVPLLAILTTLVIAGDRGTNSSSGFAHILHSAVEQTARRWEQQRAGLPGALPGPSEGELLDGFSAIGHLLDAQAVANAGQVRAAVSAMLTRRWHLSPGAAAQTSQRVCWFWDEHVGVFVEEAGQVRARSRVFAEIGAAMHCPHLTDDEITQWVDDGVADAGRHDTLGLAAQLESRVLDALVAHPAEGALLLAVSATRGMPTPAPHLRTLLRRLYQVASRADAEAPTPIRTTRTSTTADGTRSARDLIDAATNRRREAEGPVWPWAHQIARTTTPDDLQARKSELLSQLRLSPVQHLTARALSILYAADAAGRTLTADEVATVEELLRMPLPPEHSIEQSRGRLVIGSSPALLTGRSEVAALAAERLPELGEDAVALLTAIAPRCPSPDADRIAGALRRQGYTLDFFRMDASTLKMLGEADEDIRAVFTGVLKTIGQLSPHETVLAPWQRWRLPTLSAFLAMLDVGGQPIPDVRAILLDEPSTHATWIRLAALATRFDVDTLATEARAAVTDLAGANDLEQDLLDMVAAAPAREIDSHPADLSPLDQDLLVQLLTAHADPIAETAARLIWNCEIDGLHEAVERTLSLHLTPGRRHLIASLVFVLSPDTAGAVERFLHGADFATRRAAASYLHHFHDDPALERLRRVALNDHDAAIRVAAGTLSLHVPGTAAPDYWSCRQCGSHNQLSDADCLGCQWGRRPEPRKD